MPIRINLLAEEQAAEEMRRRDPIKRALYIGAALVVLMLAWIAVTHMSVKAARSELAGHDTRLRQLDESSKTVRANQNLAAEAEGKVKALEKYSTNRFFWGTVFDALQHATVENVRLTEIKTDQKYASGDVNKFFTTNINVKFTPAPSWWKVWATKNENPPILTLVSNALTEITNKAPFTTNVVDYKLATTVIGTNAAAEQVGVKTEFSNVAWAMETVTLEIRGRDYGNPPGAAIDEFARRINHSPYLKNLLEPGQGFRFTERPPQPRPDPQDPVNPNSMFVPFTIEIRLSPRVLTNE
jgi:hypothetical protein